MPKAHSRLAALWTTLALALLVGRITDITTGQPLAGVKITAAHGDVRRGATTDSRGRFQLRLPAGKYDVTWQSADVPAQHAAVRVSTQTRYDIKACSTTLDYSCGGGAPSSGSGA